MAGHVSQCYVYEHGPCARCLDVGIPSTIYALHVHIYIPRKCSLFVKSFGSSGNFALQVIAAIPTAETAGNIANILFSLTLLFCGVMATPEQMPGFWYEASPLVRCCEVMLNLSCLTGSSCTGSALLRSERLTVMACRVYF